MTAEIGRDSPRGEGLLRRIQTFSIRRSSKANTPRKVPGFVEKLDAITSLCIETLQKAKTVADQHQALGKWVASCCRVFSHYPLGIRDPNSEQNLRLLEQFVKLVPYSSYAGDLSKKLKRSERPLPDLILEDAAHPHCSVCLTAQTCRTETSKMFFEVLCPKERPVGFLGEPLKDPQALESEEKESRF